MAGKKKNKVDDAPQSKTSRASSLKKGGKQEGFIAAAPEHMNRIISLGGGEFMYLLDPRDGRTHHLRVGTVSYADTILSLLETAHAERIRSELIRKGFPIPEIVHEEV